MIWGPCLTTVFPKWLPGSKRGASLLLSSRPISGFEEGLRPVFHRLLYGWALIEFPHERSAADPSHFSLCLRDGNTRSQARGDLEEMAVVDAVRIRLQRYPHFGVWFCGEPRWYNADDLVGQGVEVYGVGEDLGIGVEVGSPEIF